MLKWFELFVLHLLVKHYFDLVTSLQLRFGKFPCVVQNFGARATKAEGMVPAGRDRQTL